MGHLVFGGVVLGGGVAVTVLSEQFIAYGAIVVGSLEILRGLFYLVRGVTARAS